MNTREIAVSAITNILQEKAYNNIILKKIFNENNALSNEEKAFITELVNGTIRNVIYLDYAINNFSNTKTNKMKPFILNLLRVSVYQIIFMEKVPVSAVCNEAVKIAKKKHFNGLSGFVNGVLRNISRNKNDIELPNKQTEPIKYLSVKYSYPSWIIENWLLEMDFETIENICKTNLLPPKICICINKNKITKENLKKIFEKENIQFEDGKLSENALYIFKTKDISKSEAFKKGYFHIMDESSMLSVEALALEKGQTVIDVCSAPGGKSFYASYLMENEGEIFSRDIHSHKIELLEQAKNRLGIKIMKIQKLDATIFNIEDENKADALIIDAPCSGLGILRKKPDIKYNKNLEHIEELSSIQKDILKACAKYVKKGGTLVYSTCTISEKENMQNVNWFLENFDFKLSPINIKSIENIKSCQKGYVQILPSMFETDGFFIAKFKRNN